MAPEMSQEESLGAEGAASIEALLDLLDCNEKRERMGSIGWQRIREKLCWEKQQVRLKEAYKRAFCD